VRPYPSQIALQYRDYARQINISNPDKAKTLTDISDELGKVSNAKEITLPDPSSAELSEIRAALKQQGITGGRKR
jgi:hypothetical protein